MFSSRVAELEQENKRLLALAQQNIAASVASSVQPEDKLMSEVEFLKAQLAAAQERERSLSAQLLQNSSSTPVIKIENQDTPTPLYSSPPPRSMALPVPHKSSASLGLMVSNQPFSFFSPNVPFQTQPKITVYLHLLTITKTNPNSERFYSAPYLRFYL